MSIYEYTVILSVPKRPEGQTTLVARSFPFIRRCQPSSKASAPKTMCGERAKYVCCVIMLGRSFSSYPMRLHNMSSGKLMHPRKEHVCGILSKCVCCAYRLDNSQNTNPTEFAYRMVLSGCFAIAATRILYIFQKTARRLTHLYILYS